PTNNSQNLKHHKNSKKQRLKTVGIKFELSKGLDSKVLNFKVLNIGSDKQGQPNNATHTHSYHRGGDGRDTLCHAVCQKQTGG
ncbi:hypothetical protein KC221_27990, partial [Mycobacterium tuberculosis]|nr:hypothetical protein [Mycobacterium tuberculosis]